MVAAERSSHRRQVQDQYPGETTPYEDCEFLYFWKSFPVIFLGDGIIGLWKTVIFSPLARRS